MARFNGRSQDVDQHVTLDGYVVRRTTDLAIGIAKAKLPLGVNSNALTWIQRSCCDDGSRIDVGDTDILVERWKADQEGLNR